MGLNALAMERRGGEGRGEEGRGGEGRRGEGGEGRGEVCTWAEFKCRADQTLQQPHNQDIHEDKAVVDWL